MRYVCIYGGRRGADQRSGARRRADRLRAMSRGRGSYSVASCRNARRRRRSLRRLAADWTSGESEASCRQTIRKMKATSTPIVVPVDRPCNRNATTTIATSKITISTVSTMNCLHARRAGAGRRETRCVRSARRGDETRIAVILAVYKENKKPTVQGSAPCFCGSLCWMH
jgi:hypothetical protein